MNSFNNKTYWFGYKSNDDNEIIICKNNFKLINIQNYLVGEFPNTIFLNNKFSHNKDITFYIFCCDINEKFKNIKNCEYFKFDYILKKDNSNIYIKSNCKNCFLKIKCANNNQYILLCNPIFEMLLNN